LCLFVVLYQRDTSVEHGKEEEKKGEEGEEEVEEEEPTAKRAKADVEHIAILQSQNADLLRMIAQHEVEFKEHITNTERQVAQREVEFKEHIVSMEMVYEKSYRMAHEKWQDDIKSNKEHIACMEHEAQVHAAALADMQKTNLDLTQQLDVANKAVASKVLLKVASLFLLSFLLLFLMCLSFSLQIPPIKHEWTDSQKAALDAMSKSPTASIFTPRAASMLKVATSSSLPMPAPMPKVAPSSPFGDPLEDPLNFCMTVVEDSGEVPFDLSPNSTFGIDAYD
jgi:hypothetical protein